MSFEHKDRLSNMMIFALKIAVGSCMAIYIATLGGLQFATSAGTITLLTIATTKWETVKLSFFRLLTFLLTVVLCWIIFQRIESTWIAYGIFTFILALVSEGIDWRNTISVNAVIGTHFLATHDFSVTFILNEFLLLLIGISIAVLFNLFQNNNRTKNIIIQSMRYTEEQMQNIMDELACYLFQQPIKKDVWEDIICLEKKLETFIEKAFEYQGNNFQSHPSYYIYYFEMRLQQLGILHNLHSEMKKIRILPKQAKIIAEFVSYLREFIVEINDPEEQMKRLEQLFDDMKKEELPKTREEFESRAMLYHILMDLEEFLIFKRRFIESLDEKQLATYCIKEMER